MLRVPRLHDLVRVEDPEVLADDLVGDVALDPLGAGVPALDQAGRGEHEDRVVADRLDQEPEPDLAAPQLLLGTALGGDVLHLGEQVQRPLGTVEHRRQRGEHPPPGTGAGKVVLELDDPLAAVEHAVEQVGELDRVTGELGVRRPHELADRTVQQRGEGAVGADHLAGQGDRGHPDRGVLEHLPEPLQVLLQDAAVEIHGRLGRLRGGLRQVGAGRRSREYGEQVVRQRLQGGRLLQERRGAELPRPVGQALLLEAAVHRHAGVRRGLQHRRQRLETVHHGHRHIEKQQVRAVFADRLDRLGAVRDLGDDVDLLREPEPDPDQRPDLGSVVGDHDRRARRPVRLLVLSAGHGGSLRTAARPITQPQGVGNGLSCTFLQFCAAQLSEPRISSEIAAPLRISLHKHRTPPSPPALGSAR